MPHEMFTNEEYEFLSQHSKELKKLGFLKPLREKMNILKERMEKVEKEINKMKS